MSAHAPDQWFYSSQGAQRGPVPLATLREMLARGQVMWTELVWTAGMPAWSPASNVRELKQPAAPGDRPPPLPPQAINYAGPMPPPPGSGTDIGADPTLRMLLPVGRSGWAIAAGYLGLLSPLVIFAPFALVVSIIAIRDIKRRDTRGMGRAILGLIMGALFTVVLLLMIASFFVR
jgi:hypothetical protein